MIWNGLYFIRKLGYTFRIVNTHKELTSYNLVVLLTDNDNTYHENFFISKIYIAIDHTPQLRNPHAQFHLGVKYFSDNPYQLYSMPIYERFSREEKKEKLVRQKKINIILLGGGSLIQNIEELSFLNGGDVEIQYYILSRNIYNELNSIKKDLRYKKKKKMLSNKSFAIYSMCKTSVLLELLSISHYVFINTNDEYVKGDKMSAAIPLAFSGGCQIIMPQEMNKTYNLFSPIFYSNKKQELLLTNNTDLDSVYSEMTKLIIHRDQNLIRILDRMFYNLE